MQQAYFSSLQHILNEANAIIRMCLFSMPLSGEREEIERRFDSWQLLVSELRNSTPELQPKSEDPR